MELDFFINKVMAFLTESLGIAPNLEPYKEILIEQWNHGFQPIESAEWLSAQPYFKAS